MSAALLKEDVSAIRLPGPCPVITTDRLVLRPIGCPMGTQ